MIFLTCVKVIKEQCCIYLVFEKIIIERSSSLG